MLVTIRISITRSLRIKWNQDSNIIKRCSVTDPSVTRWSSSVKWHQWWRWCHPCQWHLIDTIWLDSINFHSSVIKGQISVISFSHLWLPFTNIFQQKICVRELAWLTSNGLNNMINYILLSIYCFMSPLVGLGLAIVSAKEASNGMSIYSASISLFLICKLRFFVQITYSEQIRLG